MVAHAVAQQDENQVLVNNSHQRALNNQLMCLRLNTPQLSQYVRHVCLELSACWGLPF